MTTTDASETQLAWLDGLSVGDAAIDEEHRNLIARVNDLNAGLVAEVGPEEALCLMQ
jgi:hypothetical protein